MKIFEIITESFGANPYRKTTLPLSNYRGLHNPLDTDTSTNDDASSLYELVDDQIDIGNEPDIVPVPISSLHATQDWLSSEAGDEALFDGYEKYPVVLIHQGVAHILDGHNRVARAIKQGKTAITVYLFDRE